MNLIIFVLLSFNVSHACFNTHSTYTTLSGERVPNVTSSPGREICVKINSRAESLNLFQAESAAQAALASATEAERWKNEAELASIYIYQNKFREAIQLLEPIVDAHGGELNIAANLGTAYELSGEDEKAFEWIKKSLVLQRQAHEGTEWLHLEVLKAKITLKSDPNWLKKNSILGFDFGSEGKPVIPQGISMRQMDNAERALVYQLRERMFLIPPKDPITGDLLYDLSNIVALKYDLESAYDVLELALKYGLEKEGVPQKRLKFYRSQIPWVKNWISNKGISGVLLFQLALATIGLALLVFLLIFWSKKLFPK
ncbi:MAG: tetratricopeptide repeat protein [Bdellovibrionales bacterium]|nr:tetratricopeptide repeat protein [Bdellovibrionales bacterium]